MQDSGLVRGGQPIGDSCEQLDNLPPRALIRVGPIL
jgi:hypothetical protein